MLRKVLKYWLTYFKVLTIKFGAQGHRCQIAAASSKFINPLNIYMGNDNYIGPKAYFDASAKIQIGKGVIFGPNVTIYTRTHNFNSVDLAALPFDNKMITDEVIIDDYVWIASNVIILPGVKIGKFAVVGAAAVVSKNVPDYAVVVGNPAKIVKYRNKESIEKLLTEADPFVYNKFGHGKVFIKKDYNTTAQKSV